MKMDCSSAKLVVVAGGRVVVVLVAMMLFTGPLQAQETNTANAVALHLRPIAADPLEPGFHRGAQEAGTALGLGWVPANGRDRCAHTFELSKFHYGWTLGDTFAPDHWCRGHWEILQEIFAGAQSHPQVRYLVGETTGLRYNFATGTRWLPYVDGGFGVLATDIGHPNLGSVFEFNEFAGLGVNYFWRADCALNFEYRFTHLSNCGIAEPNGGLDGHIFYAGISWFF
jgi:hypothetical protein